MLDSPENKEEPTPQEKLQALWNNPESWKDGRAQEVPGLPDGMRIVETPDDMLILRSTMPGLPELLGGEPLTDVPIGVFNAKVPGVMLNLALEAKKFTNQVRNNEIKFVPPAPKTDAA